MTFDFGQLVMDDEFARDDQAVRPRHPRGRRSPGRRRHRRGGPFGDFLSHDHTMAHMRETSQPALIDRRVREDWKRSGSSTVQDRALARARTILETHVPMPLPDGVAAELAAIIRGAERELGVA